MDMQISTAAFSKLGKEGWQPVGEEGKEKKMEGRRRRR
jgi:hypothetical protein